MNMSSSNSSTMRICDLRPDSDQYGMGTGGATPRLLKTTLLGKRDQSTFLSRRVGILLSYYVTSEPFFFVLRTDLFQCFDHEFVFSSIGYQSDSPMAI